MTPKPRVVVIGGGTGLSTLLRGLKNHPISISGIVTMTDDGASTGRLRKEMGVLPPGDIRKCLAALSDDEHLLTQLFEYRFGKGRGLRGHALGNLFLTALTEITGSFDKAVQASSKILSIKGQVIPSTFEQVDLTAQLKNGSKIKGQADVSKLGHRSPIERIALEPANAKANPTAVHFIKNADLIVVGPGSLFSSVLPSFLIKEIRQAVEESSAMKIYVCNASTERGETERYSVTDHVKQLKRYANGSQFDAVLINNRVIAKDKKEGKLGAIRNITTDEKTVLGLPVVAEDLINENNPLYHDSKKLADAVWGIFTKAS